MNDSGFRISEVDLANPDMAAEVHAVQMAAYAQGAALLQTTATDFPPLLRTSQDLQADGGRYIAAFRGAQVIAAAGIVLAKGGSHAEIASFVVEPDFHRQDVGKALLAEILWRYGKAELTVATGARNLSALGLYRQFGFEECGRRTVGPANLEIIQLRRVAARN